MSRKKKKARTKRNRVSSKTSKSGKRGKKDAESPAAQAKMFFTEASSHEKSGNRKKALNCYNLALDLNPDDKNGLVARSKCYLALGDPQLALGDAETALLTDKTFVRGIYQKAEALYHLGDFEHSLMYYHRGRKLRPELEIFRLGVQKAQEAIENTIGNTAGIKCQKTGKAVSSNSSSAKTDKNDRSPAEKPSLSMDTKRSQSSGTRANGSNSRSKSAGPTARNSTKRLLGELGVDILYLENLLKHPDLICYNQETGSPIKVQAEEGIIFLNSRLEFWRQQKPSVLASKKKQN